MAASLRRVPIVLGVALGSVVVVTPVVILLEQLTDIENASTVYLVAVVISAVAAGPAAGVASAAVAVAAYNLLFTEPRFTLLVHETADWLTLLLLLGVGSVVGQLAGTQRSRAETAARREREARTLAAATRTLVAGGPLPETLRAITELLKRELGLDRVWITLVGPGGSEAIVTETEAASELPSSGYLVLQRSGSSERWTQVRRPSPPDLARHRSVESGRLRIHRILIESSGRLLGGLWVTWPARGRPSLEETRLLAGVADGIAAAVERDRLIRERVDAEIARRSDAAKTALLDAVSHDLRTPLTAIRTAAGRLADPTATIEPTERAEAAAEIETHVERLDRLVTNLLDLSRIEAGTLRPHSEPRVLADVVADSLARNATRLGATSVRLEIPDELPPVFVDDLLLDQVLANVLENCARHAPGATVRISARASDGFVRLSVEDAGPGASEAELPRLFDRFYLPARSSRGRHRSGAGLGLAIVKGFVVAMGGRVAARRSSLGGLALDIDLPLAPAGGEETAVEPGTRR